jgi:hypothetical protein
VSVRLKFENEIDRSVICASVSKASNATHDGEDNRLTGMLTTVGASVPAHGARAHVSPEAYCESMCVFLLLTGKSRSRSQSKSVLRAAIRLARPVPKPEPGTLGSA